MIAVVTSETLVTSSRGYLLVGDHAGNFSLLAVTSESADPLLLLQGQSVHSTLLEFASREGIDIMILGSKESKGTVQKLVAPGGMGSSTSDTMKSKSKCPCLIIRPAVSIIGCFLAFSYSFFTYVRYQASESRYKNKDVLAILATLHIDNRLLALGGEQSARNEKMRIKSNVNLGALLEAEVTFFAPIHPTYCNAKVTNLKTSDVL